MLGMTSNGFCHRLMRRAAVSSIALVLVAMLGSCCDTVNVRQKTTVGHLLELSDAVEGYAARNHGVLPGGDAFVGEQADSQRFLAPRPPGVWFGRRPQSMEPITAGLQPDPRQSSRLYATHNPWGHPYLYAVSRDRKHYVIVSVGCDGKLDDGIYIWRPPLEECWRDVIISDGKLISHPSGVGSGSPDYVLP